MQGGGFAGDTGGFNPAGGPMNVGAPGTTKIQAPMGAPIQPVKPLPGQVPQPVAPSSMAPPAAPQGDIYQQVRLEAFYQIYSFFCFIGIESLSADWTVNL